MSPSILAYQTPFEYGPKTPGWNEQKKYDLARAFEQIVAVGYENEFGMPPEVVIDERGVRVRWPHGPLDFCDIAHMDTQLRRAYSQIMRD